MNRAATERAMNRAATEGRGHGEGAMNRAATGEGVSLGAVLVVLSREVEREGAMGATWWTVVMMLAAPPAEKAERSVAEWVGELNACLELDCEAVRALVARGEKVWPELEVGLAHQDEMVRFWTLGVLTEVPVAAARGRIIGMLSDKAVRIRAAAAFALGAQRSPEVVEPLLVALFDADVNVRFEAASALSRVPDKRAVEPLIEVMADPDHDVRGAACEALGAIGDLRAVPTLVARLMDDRKPGVRGRAAVALGAMKAEVAPQLAKRAGRERDPEALAAMCWALGEVGKSDDGVSVKALEGLVGHTNEVVKKHAQEALVTISKKRGAGEGGDKVDKGGKREP
jgi:hypothetical protein